MYSNKSAMASRCVRYLVPCTRSFFRLLKELSVGALTLPAIALAAHQASHAVRAQFALEFVARVLTASVRMMHSAGARDGGKTTPSPARRS